MDALDGYWMPASLRQMLLAETTWQTYWLKGGQIASEPEDGSIAIRWPELSLEKIEFLLQTLKKGRKVRTNDLLTRWQNALEKARDILQQRANFMLPLLTATTGYSESMMANALGKGDLIDPVKISLALDFNPLSDKVKDWISMPGLLGKVKFFPIKSFGSYIFHLNKSKYFFKPKEPIDMVLGYAAGNIPGSSLLISLLAGVANFSEDRNLPAPSILIRNSRHEPLFVPWILSVVEEIDPELVSNIAILIWDYENASIQKLLMSQAGLMIAAAGDETIASLENQRAKYAPSLSFHKHGHKVSFAVIDKTFLHPDYSSIVNEKISDKVPLLAALDSILWDQNGCLSARVHFVEGDEEKYAKNLLYWLRVLSREIPIGTTPLSFAHRAFDYYMNIRDISNVNVISDYEDDFALIIDYRDWDMRQMQQVVNYCMGRTIVIRPIKNLLEVAYNLKNIPGANLQSVSLAIDERKILSFAQSVGELGVTSIRSLGRAAFPQLSHSWDGYLPKDLCADRQKGYFTTIEFDDLIAEMSKTIEYWQID